MRWYVDAGFKSLHSKFEYAVEIAWKEFDETLHTISKERGELFEMKLMELKTHEEREKKLQILKSIFKKFNNEIVRMRHDLEGAIEMEEYKHAEETVKSF